MREIKFRAWDRQRGRYLYNVQNANPSLSGGVTDRAGNEIEYDEPCFGAFLANDRYVVEQFAGILDCNDVDIYDRDLVKNLYSGLVSIVVWVGNGFYLKNFRGEAEMPVKRHREVVGTAVENPEMVP